MADNFLGAWRVTETVFNPDGTYAGHVHQRRELLRLANGNLRVIQNCAVSAELAGSPDPHPMGRFQGEWVFDLTVDGKNRHYLGPDVVGMGIQYVDGIMTGRGHWPRFGHSFVSFGLLDGTGRQITGGVFHDNGVAIANIIGIAVPETEKDEWPEVVALAVSAENDMPKHTFEPIVGKASYQVWGNMLRELAPSGRTHNLVPMIAGIVQYTSQVAQTIESDIDDVANAFLFEVAGISEASQIPQAIVAATEQLFADAGIEYDRHSSRGGSYSILQEALEEFIHWHSMPWER